MKGKLMPTAMTIGLIIGICLFSFILYFINAIRDNNGIKKVDTYINNCSKIKLVLGFKRGNFVVLGNINGNFGRMGADSYSTATAIFYDSNYKKYFKIEFIGSHAGSALSMLSYLKNGDTIEAVVNKIELADIAYGTQQKPIPIFKFEAQNLWGNKFPYCMNLNGEDPKTTIIQNTEQMYRNMIAIYLTFEKSRKDFNRMFPKK